MNSISKETYKAYLFDQLDSTYTLLKRNQFFSENEFRQWYDKQLEIFEDYPNMQKLVDIMVEEL